MGTKRRIAEWWMRRPGEFVLRPPGWKPGDGDIVFTQQSQMMEFARASRLVLKQRQNREVYGT